MAGKTSRAFYEPKFKLEVLDAKKVDALVEAKLEAFFTRRRPDAG